MTTHADSGASTSVDDGTGAGGTEDHAATAGFMCAASPMIAVAFVACDHAYGRGGTAHCLAAESL